MIELKNITIANAPERTLLRNQTATLPSGSLTALIGRNGCGKSTLLRVLAGIQRPVAGSIIINGIDVSRASAATLAETVAVVTTDSVKIENFTCREMVGLARSPHTGLLGRLTEEDCRIVRDSLSAVGMSEFADRHVSKLSDGEARRILLARALAQSTPVILLDEPTSFLDVPGRHEVCELLAQLARNESKTILFSTHEFGPAFAYCDLVLFMRSDGKLLLLPPEQMIANQDYRSTFTLPSRITSGDVESIKSTIEEL